MTASHVGRESTLEALGRKWRVGRWTRDVWDAFLEWAKKRLPDPLDVAEKMLARMPERLHPHIASECISRSLSYLSIGSEGVQQLLLSVEGTSHVLWLCLKEHQPEATEDDAWNILHELADGIAREALDKAAGKVPPAAEGKAPAPAA